MTFEAEKSDVWSNDLLDRKHDAAFLQEFLVNRAAERAAAGLPSSYVLNLNAAWGQGKSFFLERFSRDLEAAGHVVASVNAWRDDYAEDPLLSVMAAVDSAIQRDNLIPAKTKALGKKLGAISGQVVVAAAKGAVKQLGHRYLGEAAKEIADLLSIAVDGAGAEAGTALDKILDDEAKSLLEKFKAGQKTIEKFKASLTTFIGSLDEKKQAPVFILIDELDRCRPTYAVALLERVKHLFDIDGIVFVIATDTDQLQHAIGAVYGASFDSKKYLNRFFDSSYAFENPSYRSFVELLSEQSPLNAGKISLLPNEDVKRFITGGVDYFGLTLRDTNQMYDLLSNVVTMWQQNIPIQLCVLLPLVIGHVLGINISVTAEFATEMLRLSAQKGRQDQWIVSGYNDKQAEMTVFQAFVSMSSMTLREIYELEVSGNINGWITQAFQNEFQQTQSPAARNSQVRKSIIQTYPALIRSAGRLQPT